MPKEHGIFEARRSEIVRGLIYRKERVEQTLSALIDPSSDYGHDFMRLIALYEDMIVAAGTDDELNQPRPGASEGTEPMADTTSIEEHLAEADRITKIVKDSTAMLKKAQEELKIARMTLEHLREFQHPKLSMEVPYYHKTKYSRGAQMTPRDLVDHQIERINDLLGDKA